MKKVTISIHSQGYTFQRFLLFPLECEDDDAGVMNVGGPSSCAKLVALNDPSIIDECDPDHLFGMHCRKSCGTCGKMVLPTFLIFCPIVLVALLHI